MGEELKSETSESEQSGKTRRGFVKTAAQVAVTAPAVMMLLSATAVPASARPLYDPRNANSISGDDATFIGGRFNFGDDFVPPA